MKITLDLIPIGRVNRSQLPLKKQYYITVHDTGNTSKNSGAIRHAIYLRTKSEIDKDKYKSWHYTVDDKVIVQSLPDLEVGYNAGDGANGTGNRNSIHIEICENPESNRAKAEENAIWLIATLMIKYTIPLGSVVQHNYWKSTTYPLGKNCPRVIRARPNGWVEFNNKITIKYRELYKPLGGGDRPLDVL
ncbi:MAG: N-acetylmuramoyl-L-alanine amidase [Ignavibacteria bacterium]|nr:N-acetylmuramoyl-L-alanine amidase [Ignavibacteria bacterium]